MLGNFMEKISLDMLVVIQSSLFFWDGRHKMQSYLLEKSWALFYLHRPHGRRGVNQHFSRSEWIRRVKKPRPQWSTYTWLFYWKLSNRFTHKGSPLSNLPSHLFAPNDPRHFRMYTRSSKNFFTTHLRCSKEEIKTGRRKIRPKTFI